MSRLETMEAFVQRFPLDPFPRYALALEYRSAGRLDDAVRTLRELRERLPAYVPSYLQLGMLLNDSGRTDEAREVLHAGLLRSREAKDAHAASEIEALLESLE